MKFDKSAIFLIMIASLNFWTIKLNKWKEIFFSGRRNCPPTIKCTSNLSAKQKNEMCARMCVCLSATAAAFLMHFGKMTKRKNDWFDSRSHHTGMKQLKWRHASQNMLHVLKRKRVSLPFSYQHFRLFWIERVARAQNPFDGKMRKWQHHGIVENESKWND